MRSTMYCKHCGKELAESAFMCPDCGTPTGKMHAGSIKSPAAKTGRIASVSGFALSIISFVTAIVLVTLEIVGRNGFLGSELYVTAGLIGLVLNIYGLYKAKEGNDSVARGLAIAGIVLVSIALSYCFIAYAFGGRYYYY